MERFGSDPKDTIIVGDSDKDVLAGKNAGIDSAIVYPKINERFYKKEDLLKLEPTYFFNEYTDIAKLAE